MMTTPPGRSSTAVSAILMLKCPHCRRGNLFMQKNPLRLLGKMKMHPECPVCGQKTEIEPGFYFGTGYISYALGVAITVTTFIAWLVLIGISLDDNRIFYWLFTDVLLMVILQPYLMRLSRTIWLAMFVNYDRKAGKVMPE